MKALLSAFLYFITGQEALSNYFHQNNSEGANGGVQGLFSQIM